MWGAKSTKNEGFFPLWMRENIGPLVLMIATFFLCTSLTSVMKYDSPLKGSLSALLLELIKTKGMYAVDTFKSLWPNHEDAKTILTHLGIFSAFQAFILRFVPGPTYVGPRANSGFVPTYTDNGLACFIITLAAFLLANASGYVNNSEILRLYPSALAMLSVIALGICGFLYFKGMYFHSSPDRNTTGSFISLYYRGVELYPRVFQIDVKTFINCRFGLILWAILPIVFMNATLEMGLPLTNAFLVNIGLQLVYLFKFYLWETGYFASMDIQHDMAGYYICWGCLCWVPSVYISHSYYLSQQIIAGNFVDWSNNAALAIFAAGLLCIYINYECDLQRSYFRNNEGDCNIWGKKAEYITATYSTEDGKKHRSLLLLSGWWGVARHFHYVPEVLAAFFWSLPATNGHFMPFFYTAFLTILLLDRAYRDDARCSLKYGDSWKTYCKAVPWRIIPGII